MDWKVWHEKYDDPASPLTRRLRIVQGLVRQALNESPPGRLRVISLCAGQGRDILEVLADHSRREDVQVRLVELDEGNCELAKAAAQASGLSQVEVVAADASRSENYAGMTPADLVLICGLFGNISDADIERVVAACPQLCRTGGRVIWTRNRRAPDRVGQICGWFEERAFEREWLSDEAFEFGVGMHRFAGTPEPLALGRSLFSFVGYDRLPNEADASGAC
ncbi:class I SAM-dependent methyltransferase [Phenylobacterium sp. NIBR 498073]|uniref:class I SAM-dependent methyltransferase n=1 Tax=Phenylobacterium sp. NIBR 498073 TaxID=3015177 RepID=UPI0022B4DF54|nr:class I SAM-dependent methyltransferase [Phenylobacterium sp. NIBR 498073]WGU39402.1 class I SAM-dependent methyltransferase [Phenylobacterium sp. NIBR 498073]